MAKKSQFMTKTTSFGGKKVVMFSIDGLVWSTRKDELAGIKNRLDNQKVTLELAPKEEEGKSSEEEKSEEKEIDDGLDIPVIDTDDDIEVPVKSKSAAGAKASQKAKPTVKAKAVTQKVKASKGLTSKSKKALSKRKAA